MAGYNDYKQKGFEKFLDGTTDDYDNRILKQFNGIFNERRQYISGCNNDGHIVYSEIDYIAIEVNSGDGAIKLARRIRQLTGLQIDWYYDIVLQNTKYFNFDIAKPYMLYKGKGKLRKGDILTVSLFSIIAEYSPDECPPQEKEEQKEKFNTQDTTGSYVTHIPYNNKNYIMGVLASGEAYLSISLKFGMDTDKADLFFDVGVKGIVKGELDSENYLSDNSSVEAYAHALAGGEIYNGCYIGYETEFIYTLMGKDKGKSTYSVNKIVSNNSKIDEVDVENSVKIEVLAYDSSNNMTTIIVSYNFSGAISTNIKTPHPLININIEAGGAIKGIFYVKIPGMPLGNSSEKEIESCNNNEYGIPLMYDQL